MGFPEKYYGQSPFDLSGGQKRRVAIAGVLAMRSESACFGRANCGVLIPKVEYEILDQIAELHRQGNMTVVLVSHSMEDIAKYVERLIVMNRGEKCLTDAGRSIFPLQRTGTDRIVSASGHLCDECTEG